MPPASDTKALLSLQQGPKPERREGRGVERRGHAVPAQAQISTWAPLPTARPKGQTKGAPRLQVELHLGATSATTRASLARGPGTAHCVRDHLTTQRRHFRAVSSLTYKHKLVSEQTTGYSFGRLLFSVPSTQRQAGTQTSNCPRGETWILLSCRRLGSRDHRSSLGQSLKERKHKLHGGGKGSDAELAQGPPYICAACCSPAKTSHPRGSAGPLRAVSRGRGLSSGVERSRELSPTHRSTLVARGPPTNLSSLLPRPQPQLMKNTAIPTEIRVRICFKGFAEADGPCVTQGDLQHPWAKRTGLGRVCWIAALLPRPPFPPPASVSPCGPEGAS